MKPTVLLPTVLLPELIAPCGVDLLARECNCLVPRASDDMTALLSEADAVVVRLFEVRDADRGEGLVRDRHPAGAG